MLRGLLIAAAAAVVLLTAACSASQVEPRRRLPHTTGGKEQPRAMPCPEAADIAPCTCTVLPDYQMDMDCSDVTSSAQLAQIFSGDLPLLDYNKLTIEYNTYLTEISAGDLGQATFKEILINNGVLTAVNPDAFAYSHSTLTRLDLDNNRIDSFPFSEITFYTNLSYLSLDYNYILTFILQSSESLNYFYIGNNSLTGIDANTLNDLPALREISFIDADLQTVSIGTFVGLPQLDYIHLENNQLTELVVGTFDLSVRTTIHLYNNFISSVEVNAIGGVGGRIDIAGNQLTDLLEEVWKPLFDSGFSLDAAYNPLRCDCLITWLVVDFDYLDALSTTTTCESGEKVHDLDPSMYETLC